MDEGLGSRSWTAHPQFGVDTGRRIAPDRLSPVSEAYGGGRAECHRTTKKGRVALVVHRVANGRPRSLSALRPGARSKLLNRELLKPYAVGRSVQPVPQPPAEHLTTASQASLIVAGRELSAL